MWPDEEPKSRRTGLNEYLDQDQPFVMFQTTSPTEETGQQVGRIVTSDSQS